MVNQQVKISVLLALSFTFVLAFLFVTGKAEAEPIALRASPSAVSLNVGTFAPGAPLETPARVAHDVGQFRWPAVTLVHRLLCHAIHDARVFGKYLRYESIFNLVRLEIVINAIGDVWRW